MIGQIFIADEVENEVGLWNDDASERDAEREEGRQEPEDLIVLCEQLFWS